MEVFFNTGWFSMGYKYCMSDCGETRGKSIYIIIYKWLREGLGKDSRKIDGYSAKD